MTLEMIKVVDRQIKFSIKFLHTPVLLLVTMFIISGTFAWASLDKPPKPPVSVPKTEMGITQLSDEQMKWILDAKFGMFIHWGLYSGPGRGEWVMENEGIRPVRRRH